MPRWHDPDLSPAERAMLDAIGDPNPDEWSSSQKAEWEAMSNDPEWYQRRKAEWARHLEGENGRIDCDQQPTPDKRKAARRAPGRDPGGDPGLLPIS